MVPVPLAFHPALVTVITMLPDAMATALNTLICPVVPAANVAVSAAAVVKKLVVLVRLAAALAAKSSLPVRNNGSINLFRGRVNSLRYTVAPPSSVWNWNSYVPVSANVIIWPEMPCMPDIDAALAPVPTAAGNVNVCAMLATVTRTMSPPCCPAAGKLLNANVIEPDVVTV